MHSALKKVVANPVLSGMAAGGTVGAASGLISERKSKKSPARKGLGVLRRTVMGAGIGGLGGAAADMAPLAANYKKYQAAHKAGRKTRYSDIFKKMDDFKEQFRAAEAAAEARAKNKTATLNNRYDTETYQMGAEHMYGSTPQHITTAALGLGLGGVGLKLHKALRAAPGTFNRRRAMYSVPLGLLGAAGIAAVLDNKLKQNRKGKRVFSKLLKDKPLNRSDKSFLNTTLNDTIQDTTKPLGRGLFGSAMLGGAGFVASRDGLNASLAGVGLGGVEKIRSSIEGFRHGKRYKELKRRNRRR